MVLLSVGENVGLYLSEHQLKPPAEIRRIVSAKLELVGLKGLEDRSPGIDIHGRPVLLGDVLDGDVFDAQLAAEIVEVVHTEIRSVLPRYKTTETLSFPQLPDPQEEGL